MRNGLHIDSDGSKYWYVNNKLHRVDGPAIEHSDGFKAWYLDGKQLQKEDFTLELIEQLDAWKLFTPVEIVTMMIKENA